MSATPEHVIVDPLDPNRGIDRETGDLVRLVDIVASDAPPRFTSMAAPPPRPLTWLDWCRRLVDPHWRAKRADDERIRAAYHVAGGLAWLMYRGRP